MAERLKDFQEQLAWMVPTRVVEASSRKRGGGGARRVTVRCHPADAGTVRLCAAKTSVPSDAYAIVEDATIRRAGPTPDEIACARGNYMRQLALAVSEVRRMLSGIVDMEFLGQPDGSARVRLEVESDSTRKVERVRRVVHGICDRVGLDRAMLPVEQAPYF
jgi:hypothetical protein